MGMISMKSAARFRGRSFAICKADETGKYFHEILNDFDTKRGFVSKVARVNFLVHGHACF